MQPKRSGSHRRQCGWRLGGGSWIAGAGSDDGRGISVTHHDYKAKKVNTIEAHHIHLDKCKLYTEMNLNLLGTMNTCFV